MAPIVQNLIDGHNCTVLLLGPSGSGKTHTLYGKQGTSRGLLLRTVQRLLQFTTPFIGQMDVKLFDTRQSTAIMNNETDFIDNNAERVFLRASVYMINCDNIYDLLVSTNPSKTQSNRSLRVDTYINKETFDVQSRIVGLQERLIIKVQNFNHMLQEAMQERQNLAAALDNKEIRKRSHLIISLNVVRRNRKGDLTSSVLNFVELAGSEQSVTTTLSDALGKDSTGRFFITKGLNSLSSHLVKIALDQNSAYAEDENELLSCLRPTLTRGSSVLLINCVSPSNQHFHQTFLAVQGCQKIRDKIITGLESRHPTASLTAPQLIEFASKENQKLNPQTVTKIEEQLKYVEKDAELYQRRIDESGPHSKQSINDVEQWCMKTSDYLLSVNQQLNGADKNLRKRVKSLIQLTNEIKDKIFLKQKSPPRTHQTTARSSLHTVMKSTDGSVPVSSNDIRSSPRFVKQEAVNNALVSSNYSPPKSLSLISDRQKVSNKSSQPESPTLKPTRKSFVFVKHVDTNNKLQEALMSPQLVHEKVNKIFENPQRPSQHLYKSEKETLADLHRLIMFEDFEGIKSRVVTMQRERNQCEVLIDAQIQEIKELRNQIVARDTLFNQTEQLNEKNVKEYTAQINQTLKQGQEKRNELESQIQDLQHNLQIRCAQLEQKNVDLATSERKLAEAVIFGDENRRGRLTAESHVQMLKEQIEKITFAHESYKEHQLNVIKTLEQNNQESKEKLQGKIDSLREVISNKDTELNHQYMSIQQLEERVRALQTDIQLWTEKHGQAVGQIQTLEYCIERKAREIDELHTQIGSNMEHIGEQRNTVHRFQIDQQELLDELSVLQKQLDYQNELIGKMETALDEKALQLSQLQNTLKQEREKADDQIQQKTRELKDSEQRELASHQKLFNLQQDYIGLERSHRSLKVYEQETSDVLSVNSHYKNQIQQQKLEIDQLTIEKQNFENENLACREDIKKLEEHINMLERESEHLRYLQKDTIQAYEREMATLNRNELSRRIHQEDLELRRRSPPRLKYVDQLPLRKPNIDLNSRLQMISPVISLQREQPQKIESDLQSLMPVDPFREIASKQQNDAFNDIKQMLEKYKHSRANMKQTQNQSNFPASLRVQNAFQLKYDEKFAKTGQINHSFGAVE